MKAGEIIGSFVESIIKIVVAIVIVMYVFIKLQVVSMNTLLMKASLFLKNTQAQIY